MSPCHIELPGQAKPLHCGCSGDGLEVGMRCIAETAGRTVSATLVRIDIPGAPAPPASGQVIRAATTEDDEAEGFLQSRREECLRVARQRAAELDLAMRFVRADPVPSGRKVTLHFISDNRVDFRQLVRDLARELRARVELRQIGVRDAAILQGGIGHCGQPLCCSRWLDGFAPVSMKMAKAQGLPVNPVKISGQCGRLMCCLRYELSDEQREVRPSRGEQHSGEHRGGGGEHRGGHDRRGGRDHRGRDHRGRGEQRPGGAPRPAAADVPRPAAETPPSGGSGGDDSAT